MFLRVILCAVFALAVDDNVVVNSFIDSVLHETSKRTSLVEPEPFKIPVFQIQLRSIDSFSRNVEANFFNGSIWGFTKLKRQSDCRYDPHVEPTIIAFTVSLSEIKISISAYVKGDKLTGIPHRISTLTHLTDDSLLFVGVIGRPFDVAEKLEARVPEVTMSTSITEGKLELSVYRLNNFKRQLHALLNQHVQQILENSYLPALNASLNFYPLAL